MSCPTSSELTIEMLKKRVSGGRMDLSSLRLNKVPIELMCRSLAGQRITSLDLSNNLLTSFSTQFMQLFPNIQEIDLHSNKIKRLPENFGILTNLRRLDLSKNQIKKLPTSFAELDQLQWLNLADNPLENDLAEVVGSCSCEDECSFAAKSAVQYVQFFSALSSESTAIADEAFLQNETSSNSSADISSNKNSSGLRKSDNEKRRKKLRRNTEKQKQQEVGTSNSHEQIVSSVCALAIRFAFALVVLVLLAIPIWLTFDSIRDVCVSFSALPPGRTLPDGPWEERRLCAQLTHSLVSGTLPTPFGEFVFDFFITFKQHWSHAVNDRLMESIPSQLRHNQCLVLIDLLRSFTMAWTCDALNSKEKNKQNLLLKSFHKRVMFQLLS